MDPQKLFAQYSEATAEQSQISKSPTNQYSVKAGEDLAISDSERKSDRDQPEFSEYRIIGSSDWEFVVGKFFSRDHLIESICNVYYQLDRDSRKNDFLTQVCISHRLPTTIVNTPFANKESLEEVLGKTLKDVKENVGDTKIVARSVNITGDQPDNLFKQTAADLLKSEKERQSALYSDLPSYTQEDDGPSDDGDDAESIE